MDKIPRKLEIRYWKPNNNTGDAWIHFVISKQSHRLLDFCKGGNHMRSGDIYLKSYDYPECLVTSEDQALYVRGDHYNRDWDILRCPQDKFFELFVPIILMYNREYTMHAPEQIHAEDVCIDVSSRFRTQT